MGAVAVAMHQADGDRTETLLECGLQLGTRCALVERGDDFAVRADALIHLDDGAVEHLRQVDPAHEELGARLIGNAQLVAEAARNDQQRALALALEQRVGGDRGAHLDRLDQRGGDRLIGLDAQQLTDALNGGVTVALGVLGEQLVSEQRAIGTARDDVGEGAAPVDPELPLLHGR